MNEAKRKANARYDKNNTRVITLKFNKNTDKDILDLLESVDNTQGFIKQLLRKEIQFRVFLLMYETATYPSDYRKSSKNES